MIDTEALRKKVIDLAIQGKLTEQLPSDGSAETLIEQIANEKLELIGQGKIPKEKSLPNIAKEEIPFVIPDSWRWVRVQDVASYITDYVANGSFATLKEHTKTYKEPNYAIFVRTMDFGTEFKEGCSYIDKESYEFLGKSKLFGGELILPNIGASIGKAFVMPDLGMPMSLAPNSILLKFIYSEMNEYFSFVVKSTYGQQLLNKTQGGSATAKFSKTDLRTLVVPLPPICEITRIVNKIRELGRYIDCIDNLQAKYSNDLVALRNKIIDAGIRGKLTEQLPEDGTAEELYQHIQEEKATLIKEGKIKKEKPLPDIAADEIPFEIPKNWKWVRIGDVTYNHGQKTPQNKFCYIDVGTLDNVNHKLNTKENIVEAVDAPSRAKKIVELEDVLYSTVRPYLHNICIVDRDFSYEPIASTAFAIMHTIDKCMINRYLFFWLLSEWFDKYANGERSKGALYPAIGEKDFFKGLVPLPPFEEQKRIVSKIDMILQQL